MQKPQLELPLMLTALAIFRSPAELRAAVKNFYTNDASLHHPFGIVEHGENSSQKSWACTSGAVSSAHSLPVVRMQCFMIGITMSLSPT
ncbi:hypothetical protein F4604DRAFT_493282 [Suillus subluteus]|nr:hypothetical protein F4604DRAFT_493282 [Suillus subluteus]